MKTIKTLLLSVALVASAAALADDSYILYWYASVTDPYSVLDSSKTYYAAIGVNDTSTYLTGVDGKAQYFAFSGSTLTTGKDYGSFSVASSDTLSSYNFYLSLFDGDFNSIYTGSAVSYETIKDSIAKSGSTSGGASTTAYGFTAAVPEPTSGLLMLLGLAGLALRRKRA